MRRAAGRSRNVAVPLAGFRSALAAIVILLVGCGPGVTPIRTPFNIGVYHYARGELAAAASSYRAALSEDADDHRARFNLAVTLEELAAEAAAQGEPEAARRLHEEAGREYHEVLRREPAHERAAINLAARTAEGGDLVAARQQLAAVAAQHPSSAAPWSALAAMLLTAYHQEADEPLRRQHLDDAHQAALRSLELDSHQVTGNMILGDVLIERRETDLARQAYQRALATDPDDLATHLALARLEFRLADWVHAELHLAGVLQGDPEHVEAHWLLSRSYLAAGRLEESALHLWRARRIDLQQPGPPRFDYHSAALELYRLLAEAEAALAGES